jgi:Bacterial protein of unknown function (DUF937)/PRC-barrel domain
MADKEAAMYGSMTPLLTEFLKPDLIAKMASRVGISDVASVQKTISGAVPAILSGLANLVSTPDGARQLSAVIASQPSNLLENLAGTADGPGQLANIGNTALTTLFGDTTLGALAGALGKFAGVSEGAARTLLGMVAPVILGVLGRQTGGGIRALTQFFALQKDQFVRAIPPGLSDLLKTSGIDFQRFGTASTAPLRATETHRAGEQNASRAAYAMGSSRPSQSSARWAYWVIPLLAIAGLLWYLLGRERTREPVVRGPEQAVQPAAQGPVADSDLQRQITAALETLNGTLQGVKDPASAGQGLPRLQQVGSELDRLRAAADRLPVESRERIAEGIKVSAARLRSALDNVTAMPGMGGDVGPVIVALRTKVDALARTPGSLAQRRVIYLARTPSGGVLASTYFDKGMHNRGGEKIGSISDLIIAPDGTIAAALVGVGGFLGIGEKEVAVPFSSIEVVRNGTDLRFVIDATKDALKTAPSYEDTAGRVHLTPAPSTNR